MAYGLPWRDILFRFFCQNLRVFRKSPGFPVWGTVEVQAAGALKLGGRMSFATSFPVMD